MPAAFTAVRNGLKAQLDTISGLHAYAYVPDEPNLPAAIVMPLSGTFLTFDTTMSRGSDDMSFIILVLLSKSSDVVGQDTLDTFLDGLSVKAAIEDDETLGGVAHFTAVTEVRNYGTVQFGQESYYGCEFVVTVGV